MSIARWFAKWLLRCLMARSALWIEAVLPRRRRQACKPDVLFEKLFKRAHRCLEADQKGASSPAVSVTPGTTAEVGRRSATGSGPTASQSRPPSRCACRCTPLPLSRRRPRGLRCPGQAGTRCSQTPGYWRQSERSAHRNASGVPFVRNQRIQRPVFDPEARRSGPGLIHVSPWRFLFRGPLLHASTTLRSILTV